MGRRAALAEALDQLEADAVDVIERALEPVVDRIVAAAVDQLAPVTASAAFDTLTDVLTEWGVAVDADVLDWFAAVYRAGGLAAVGRLVEMGITPAAGAVAPDEFMDEAAARHLAMVRPRFIEIGDVAWRHARLRMVEGLEQGHGVDAIALSMRETVDLTRAVARQVARTEVVAAANAGSVKRMELEGDNGAKYKQWLSTLDSRTRPTHVTADGQVVERNAVFQVGGRQLQYPGDIAGGAEETINCRCTILWTDSPDGEVDDVDGRQEGGVLDDVDVPAMTAASVSAHLSGKHDQRKHARKGGGGRAGMGDVELDADTVAAMQGGSAAAHIVQRPDGTYGFTPERQALHDDIVTGALEGKTPSANPTYHVLGGGPASGKTEIVVNSPAGAKLRDPNGLMVNADDMKAELPEYSAMLRSGDTGAAHFTHEESSYLAKRLQAAGFENRLDVTLDGTGDSAPAKLRGKIARARAAGYRVEGHYATVPTDVAVSRAVARGERTGRVVPETYLRATHAAVSRTAAETYTDFDAFDLYDTSSGTLEGARTSTHVMSYRDGSTTIHDQPAWDAFIAKGSEA
jgi:predicted ABC-type ATPase